MSQKIFIPLTDEILYNRPELITSPLRPFQVGHPCFRWLSAEIESVDPDTVDIDPNVELKMAATAMNFSPIDIELADPPLYQRVSKKPFVVPCKDAA